LIKAVESIEIARLVNEVFAYVGDPRNKHTWQPGLHSVKNEDKGHSVVRELMGRRVEHHIGAARHRRSRISPSAT